MKRIVSVMLCIIMILTARSAYATSYILDSESAHGYNYTNIPKLEKMLDDIFDGDIDLYTDSEAAKEVIFPVGSRMSTSTLYYVKSKTTGNNCAGYQCYIYANAVYNKLFNEWAGHGDALSHSEVVLKGGNSVSYEQLSKADVRCGAYMRTTSNSNGSYNGSNGHSLIILSYDKSKITYLEGNADAKGLIRITEKTWSEFNSGLLSGKSRYVSHVVQPVKSYYESLYPGQNTDRHEVKFMDYDGSILKTEYVLNGESATPPEPPVRTGYTFSGWQGEYSRVTSNRTITATYQKNISDYILGDANGDGKVDTEDATTILRFAAYLISGDEIDVNAADIDRDGRVTTADATGVLRLVAGI